MEGTSKEAVKELECPGCGGVLADVWAEANYGRVLLLDQCRRCGGVWFDKWELYFLKDSAAEDLEKVDPKSFGALNPASKGSGDCPRCAVGLAAFIDPNLPPDAVIKRCPQCSGLWLNRGEITKYVNHRKNFARDAGQIDLKLKADTLKHLQSELKASTLGGGPPTLSTLGAGVDDGPIDGKELAKDIGWLALEALARLVFKI